MTNEQLRTLATSGQLVATEHGVYYPHDGAAEHAECPSTGHVWDGAVHATPCPIDHTHLRADVEILDSNTGLPLTAEELVITCAEYHELAVESLACPQDEGHVRSRSGRRVYVV